ncbi:MAG TPA: guanitoxin biosynthesis heme-dependent pre-guanitoxin N-hydroxylase GntA [Flavobacterium sp.]|jgi:hypothetical protein
MDSHTQLTHEWEAFIGNSDFPCVAAKAALVKEQQHIFVASHIACPHDDTAILQFLYDFVDNYRNSDSLFHSAIVIFEQPKIHSEQAYSRMFWQRLQALSDLDAIDNAYDTRVSSDPDDPNFSFSLKGEAFFVIGVHPANNREARRFSHPAIVFNPHAQFEQLRENRQYGKMQKIIRKRDIALEGSINPMLTDFGDASETYQYTGQQLDKEWKCPLQIHHGKIDNNKSA